MNSRRWNWTRRCQHCNLNHLLWLLLNTWLPRLTTLPVSVLGYRLLWFIFMPYSLYRLQKTYRDSAPSAPSKIDWTNSWEITSSFRYNQVVYHTTCRHVVIISAFSLRQAAVLISALATANCSWQKVLDTGTTECVMFLFWCTGIGTSYYMPMCVGHVHIAPNSYKSVRQ